MNGTTVKLAPSILAADFARLGEQVTEAEKAGANRIHVDVMDGHFVPNISMGVPIVKSLRPITRLPLETHLMISEPDLFLEEFAEAGSDSFLVHWEGNNNLHRTVWRIKELGKRAGVVINPATPASVLEEILPELDLVVVMTVNPGFGHQHFLHSTLPKIGRVRQMIKHVNPRCEIEVDGGVDQTTAPLAGAAGADVFVAGSSIFGESAGVAASMNRLHTAIVRRDDRLKSTHRVLRLDAISLEAELNNPGASRSVSRRKGTIVERLGEAIDRTHLSAEEVETEVGESEDWDKASHEGE